MTAALHVTVGGFATIDDIRERYGVGRQTARAIAGTVGFIRAGTGSRTRILVKLADLEAHEASELTIDEGRSTIGPSSSVTHAGTRRSQTEPGELAGDWWNA